MNDEVVIRDEQNGIDGIKVVDKEDGVVAFNKERKIMTAGEVG